MIDEQKPEIIDNSVYSHFVGVSFLGNQKSYFFGFKDLELQIGDKVVVETIKGIELGEITLPPVSIEKYSKQLGLKPIIRKANDIDIRMSENNKNDAVYAMDICKKEVLRLGLDMNLLSCEYTLDKAKVLFSYVADERVDFRELLKSLAMHLHTRIELRQIGSRDKAKMIGGLGICGLPLCCSTFLNEFDGISIMRAKNQMLVINIPKLSGQCGKLICCLKYEDDAYTEERKKYPELGSKVFIDKQEYTITNVNVISGMIKIENPDDIKVMHYDDLKKQTNPKAKRFEDKPKNDNTHMSDEEFFDVKPVFKKDFKQNQNNQKSDGFKREQKPNNENNPAPVDKENDQEQGKKHFNPNHRNNRHHRRPFNPNKNNGNNGNEKN